MGVAFKLTNKWEDSHTRTDQHEPIVNQNISADGGNQVLAREFSLNLSFLALGVKVQLKKSGLDL